jgi:hypothetical protein
MNDNTNETAGATRQQPNAGPGVAPESGPPALPPPVRRATETENQRGLFPTFGDSFARTDRRLTPLGIVDALLKHPDRAVYEIVKGRRAPICLLLFLVSAVCMAAYGLAMATFAGGPQLWMVPAKLVVGSLLSALICLPSLYILTSLAGGNQSLDETLGLLLVCLALSGILLVGFAPITWIFAQSTNTVSFMGTLHLTFWLIGTILGLRLLATALRFLNKRRMGILTLWCFVYVAVALQMTTTLRPLVGGFQGYELQGRKFFLTHWGDCLASSERVQSSHRAGR